MPAMPSCVAPDCTETERPSALEPAVVVLGAVTAEGATARVQTLLRLDSRPSCGTWRATALPRVFDDPKTTATLRTIPLPDAALRLLALWKARTKRTAAHELIFSTVSGKPISPNNVLRRWVWPACEAADLPRVTWLTFRRTYSSWAHDKGVSAKVVALIMGHTKVDTTMNVYTQIPHGAARAAADRVGSRIVQNCSDHCGSPVWTTFATGSSVRHDCRLVIKQALTRTPSGIYSDHSINSVTQTAPIDVFARASGVQRSPEPLCSSRSACRGRCETCAAHLLPHSQRQRESGDPPQCADAACSRATSRVVTDGGGKVRGSVGRNRRRRSRGTFLVDATRKRSGAWWRDRLQAALRDHQWPARCHSWTHPRERCRLPRLRLKATSFERCMWCA